VRFRFPIPILSTLTCLLTLVPLGASAQTAADLFDRNAVQEIRLFINSRDLDQLRTKFREDIYYVVDLHWRNIRVRNAAVRSRGGVSRNPSKPALRIDFNRYTTGQRFLGLRALVLDNLWQQPSFVAESTTMAFFDRLGQPAPRLSFCRLYINNLYHGVYTIVEAVDTDFLARTLGENAGYLFSYQLHARFYGDYLGDDLKEYKLRFQPQTHELDSDAILYAPIRDLFREVNHPEDGVWRDRVEQYVDLRQFVTHVAIENFVAEIDGILGTYSMNNFYLYRSAGTSQHRLIAWDKDSTFAFPDLSIFWNAEENVLFRRAMGYRDLFELYLEVLERCAIAAAEDDWLEREIMRAATLVAPHVRADVRKRFSNDEFDEAVILLQQFAKERPSFVLKEVQKIRAARR
jgi:spore coat protein CotH